MWVVRKIGFVTSKGVVHYEISQVMSSFVVGLWKTAVHIANTETGDFEVLYSNPDGSYIRQLREFSPYGFVDRNIGSDMVQKDNYLVAVDDISLQLLNYVDSVEEVHFSNDCEMRSFVEGLTGAFVGVDSDNTLFLVDSNPECCCTLLHAMCYASDGWRGDDFYLFSRRGFEHKHDLNLTDILYRVRFCDVAAARRLVTKTMVSQINIVSDFVNANHPI